MKVSYLVEITNPENHIVKVRLKCTLPLSQSKISVFLPSWSPGSYLMREYARHVRSFEATQGNGERLFHTQTAKGTWEIDRSLSMLNKTQEEVEVCYEVYCHELTVRTSHVDRSHAFLHGPTYLMGIVGMELDHPQVEFRFPPLWSHLTTSLQDVSKKREVFLYEAKNYDELIDTPVEIGCHETDGFKALGKDHFLAFYGVQYPHKQNLKKDIQTIVEFIGTMMGGLPYEHYTFITHFAPKLMGGLEHLNSTALHFDGRKLGNRKDYLNYLSLTAHEFFHTWNVKRIRPKELGPFDYLNENYTTMLWLAEGLTSYLDDLFVYRAGLCTLEEYLEFIKGNLEMYYQTPGRRYHSLEESSFNAWVKLYRPDENTKNSSISYYLKGGLVFGVLDRSLQQHGKSINDFVAALWKSYEKNPSVGVTANEVFDLVENLGGKKIRDDFVRMVQTTEEIDFDSSYQHMGVELKWGESGMPVLGIDWDFVGDRAIVRAVTLDSAAYKAGINPMDEVIALNGLRVMKEDVDKISLWLQKDTEYTMLVSRLGKIEAISIIPLAAQRSLREMVVMQKGAAEKALLR